MRLLVFFLLMFLVTLACGHQLALKIEDRSGNRTFLIEPITINYPTFDKRINVLCQYASDTYMLDVLGETVACVIDEVPILFSETADISDHGKNPMRLEVVKVNFTFSSPKEPKVDDDGNKWWHKNKTCMMLYADPIYCKLLTPPAIIDSDIIRKKCYFVHGVGESGPNTIIPAFPEYWGNMAGYTPQCTERHFLWMDTRSRSFDSPELMKTVCRLITNSTTKREIKDSYIFTHSMGGLIMTMAVMNGMCTVDKNSSTIYMASPPLAGSETAVFVDRACKGEFTVLVQTVARVMNYCRPGDLGAWPAYFPMNPANPIFASLYYAGGLYGNGFLCGDCNFTDVCGQGSLPQTDGLKALAIIAGLPYPNDGMVTKASCNSPFIKKMLSDDPTSAFYKGNMNHADTSCRNGDSAVWNSKACQWFSGRYLVK